MNIDLPIVFTVLMGAAILAYVVLDGYDLGVGMLMPAAGRDEQNADAEDKPRFVRIPERADRRDHHVLFRRRCSGHQHADAEVVAVEHDVEQDREAHQATKDERQIQSHVWEPLRARWVSTTMYAVNISA